MGSINIIKPLSTFHWPVLLINLSNINNLFLWNNFGNAGNQTRYCWVRSKYASSVLCSPIKFTVFVYIFWVHCSAALKLFQLGVVAIRSGAFIPPSGFSSSVWGRQRFQISELHHQKKKIPGFNVRRLNEPRTCGPQINSQKQQFMFVSLLETIIGFTSSEEIASTVLSNRKRVIGRWKEGEREREREREGGKWGGEGVCLIMNSKVSQF